VGEGGVGIGRRTCLVSRYFILLPDTQTLGTAKGRYEQSVQDAVGARWNDYVRERRNLIKIGTTKIRFYVRPNGKTEDVKVLGNSSNETLASTSVQSIIKANIPPIPKELLPLPSGDRMEFTMTFNFTY
jgi:TonB family protein